MFNSLYIAWKYLSYHKIRTCTLVACITLITVLPLALDILLDESERQFLSRAKATPLVLGAKGSSLDLVMNSLYFNDTIPQQISMSAQKKIMRSGLALPIPLHVRFKARGYPIVGTTIDYFDFRKLTIVEGRGLAFLGECVLGAEVARTLNLQSGDSLISSPESLFDLAGMYPLKMNVVGILAATQTADDLAIFVDLKTGWVIEGLGHGHINITRTKDSSVVLEKTDENVIANAKLMEYTEITEQNMDSFHFHGAPDQFPISSVIALPRDEKSQAILLGRYLTENLEYQMIRPEQIIEGLLENIFRIKNVLDAVILIVGLSTLLALLLVFSLSLRLRQQEIDTIFKLGCNRATIARLIFAEILIIMLISSLFCTGILLVTARFDEALIRYFIM